MQVGKSVRLVTEGENTEVDKTVIERLSDPITHMLRNAIMPVVTIVALWPLRIAAYRVFERLRPEERSIVVDLRQDTKASQLLDVLERENARVEHFQLEDEHDRRIVTLTLDTPSETLLSKLADLDFVQGVEWRR